MVLRAASLQKSATVVRCHPVQCHPGRCRPQGSQDYWGPSMNRAENNAKYRWAQMRSRLCSRQLHVSYQAWCKLAFQFFNRVGPLEWFGGLVVVSNEVQDGLLKLIQAAEMIGLQEFALQQTEPNFDLIEPRGIGRQPIELHRQFSIQRRR